MSGYSADQVCSPPELPSYLKGVHDLKQIVGVPNEEEVMRIHAVIRIAHKFVDVPDMCNPVLLNYLSTCSMFKWNVTYTPPTLPAHVAAKLEPVSGLPSNQDVMKVQNAIQLYQKFSDIPNMFDPQSYADLSQHLFNIQMERYMRSRGPTQAYFIPLPTAEAGPTSSETIERGGEQANLATNNPGSGANGIESHWPPQFIHDVGTRDAMERSNQLAERANLLAERSNVLIERSNQIAERANQLAQQSNQTAECLNRDTKRFNELFGHLGQHLERSEQYYGQSTRFTQELTHPLVKIGDVLKNINKVLVGIQHAIVRNRRGNGLGALDCLVNEKGETPGASDVTSKASSNFPG